MALILVVVVIAALVAISAPFALTMRLHEKSARGFAAHIKARRLAESARNDAIAALYPTHPDEERRQRVLRGDNNGDDEDWDSLDEVSPRVRDISGLQTKDSKGLDARGTKTTMTDVQVRDERSRIDINGAPAEIIANLFGATVTTAELDYDETAFLPVEDVRPFFSDGDPNTLDGIVRINGEFIGYRDISTNPPGLKGLVRGMFFSRIPPPDDPAQPKIKYPAGSLVQDFRGWKIAWDPIWRYAGVDGKEGELARFETPSAIRKIADWEFGTLAAALYFQQNGVTFEKLKEWGIVQEKMDRAGLLDSVDAKAAQAKEDADQRKRREDAEKGLRSLGVNPDTIRRFGGERAVIRAWELLEGLDPEQKESLAKSFRDRGEKLEAQEMKHESFWRGEVKRQLDELIAIRERTPEIETIGRIELERIRPYITVDSPHEGEAWTDPQPVNHVVRYEPYQPFCVMQVQDGRRFRNGMIVKIQPIAPPGANTSVPYGGIPEYRKVVGVHQQPDHWAISVFPQLERDYDASTIELSGMLPRPVNLNAAPKEVLVALFTGLQTRLFQKASAAGTVPPDFVTPTAAAAIADKILANPLKCHQDLAGLLAKAVTESTITAGNGEAILQCAVDPANKFLSHAGVPMVYTSGDVYEITATGIVNDEAANEVARVKTREIVQVAPPRDLVWVLDSQQDFQDRVGNLDGLTIKNDPRSLSPAYFRGIWTNLVETFPQDVFAAPWLFPQRAHEKSSSPPTEVKLAMSRDWDQPGAKPAGNGQGFQPGVTLAAHYDNERSGHQNKNDVQIPAANLQLRTWVMEDGATRRVLLGPGTARAWFRTDQLGGPKMACFFDAGVDDNRDRMTCGYDLETHELVATIHDESLDMLETGGKPRPSGEVRFAVPLRQEQQNWYHVAFAWKGSERGDLALCLDGKPVGTDRTGTKTTAQIDANTLSIPVESTAAFPPRGFIRIGGFRHPDGILAGDTYTYQWSTPPWSIGQFYGEVLYYESKTDTAFNIAQEQNPWAQAWLQRHQAQPGQPQPTPPEGSDTATRVPHRGTGRFSEEPDPGFLPLPVRRGAAHETGTPVYLWGYTLWLKNGPNWSTRSQGNPAVSLPPKLPQYSETLHQGKAELIEALPQNTPCTFVYKPNPPGWNAATNPRPVVVQPQDNEVPVVWAAPYPDAGTVTGGWPAQGVIRIGNERMFYTSIIQDKDAPKFVVQRGLDGTTPQAHRLWETVVLESIHVTPNQDYATRNNLVDPEVFLQLTPPQTPATLATTLDPRTPCSVEWVSILTPAPPLSPQFMIIPAVRGDGVGRGQSLLPNPEAPRFIALPQQPVPGQPALPGQPGPPGKPPLPAPNPPGQPPGQGAQPGGPVDVPLRGDGRWIAAMEQEFANLKGRLPPNAGNAPIVVPPPLPPKPGAKIAGAPPLPGATKPLKEWLKMMDGNHSRAQKATSQQPIWSQTNPQATTVLGGRQHQPGEKVIPTFVIGATHTNDVRDIHFCGKGDTITLADDTELPREEHTIVWRAETDAGTNAGQNGPSLTGDAGTGVLVALDDFTQRVYKGADHARIVRFPSGQMPHGPPPMMVGAPGVKSPVGGAVQGMIDELIVTAEPEPSAFEDQIRSYGGANNTAWPVVPFLDIGASTYDTCLKPSNGLTQYLRGGVIFKLEDEILGVNDVSAGTLGQGLHVVRGMLGTTAASHGNEASFWWNFPFPRLAVAEYGFSLPKGDQISLRPRTAGPLHDHDFVVALDRGQGAGIVELLPIRQQRGNFLLRPRDRWDRGTFRAQFGSGLAQPDPGPGDILFDWPFRYQDRYQARVSSLEGVFVEATKEAKGAYFQSITWDASLQNNFQKVLVAVRVDGAPAWDSEPAKADEIGVPGKLYLFDDPKKENKILVRGDRVEVRVYMTLKPGAFYQDGWKQTPILHAVKLTYRQPTRVRRREEMLE